MDASTSLSIDNVFSFIFNILIYVIDGKMQYFQLPQYSEYASNCPLSLPSHYKLSPFAVISNKATKLYHIGTNFGNVGSG